MVTTVPAVPVMGSVIKIFFDSHQDLSGLKDYTGDVYAPKGSYIEFAGFANDVFAAKAKPTVAGEKK